MHTAKRCDHPRSRWRLGRALAVLVVCAGLAIAVAGRVGLHTGTAHAATRSRSQLLSIFWADTQLDANPVRAMRTLRGLGVQVVRTSIYWANVVNHYTYHATRPPQLKPTDPGTYPPAGWALYDRIDRAAAKTGMRLFFTITGPTPIWAAGRGRGSQFPVTWKPAAAAFGAFVRAVGRRYSGRYTPHGASNPLPRISFWSIWNEPNYGSRLTPQVTHGRPVSPRLYRRLLNAGWSGLQATGHGPRTDTVLIGETAPFGNAPARVGVNQPVPEMAPLAFIRALYCVGPNLRPLRRAAATRIGCARSPHRFRARNPGLFNASGWAVHPYTAGKAPNVHTTGSMDYTEFSTLPRLGRTLDRVARAYGSRARLPIYSTEFGFRTNPPNTGPFSTSLRNAARYMNQAEYLSWRNRRIRSYMQYQLADVSAHRYEYSTGLRFFGGRGNLFGGRAKPSFRAYRMPLWLPRTRATRRRRSLEVWGCARAAPLAAKTTRHRQRVRIQFAPPRARYRTAKTVTLAPARHGCYFETSVRFARSGRVRLAWSGQHSRTQSIRVR